MKETVSEQAEKALSEQSTEGIDKADYEALATFRYALRQFMHFSEEEAHKIGLTPQQHQALLAIQGFPGRDFVTVGELAERLQIRHHSAVGLVNRLTAQGLTERRSSEQDRRQVYVCLTMQGMDRLERLTLAHREELRRLSPQLAQLPAKFKTKFMTTKREEGRVSERQGVEGSRE